MAVKGISTVYVLEGPRLVGTITDRDITVRATALDVSASRKGIGSVMMAGPVTVEKSDPIATVVSLMEDHLLNEIPVVDGQGELLSVITLEEAQNQPAHSFVQDLMMTTSDRMCLMIKRRRVRRFFYLLGFDVGSDWLWVRVMVYTALILAMGIAALNQYTAISLMSR